MRPRLLVLIVALFPLGCAVTVTPATKTPHQCPDGLPPKLLLDPGCPSGICGFTCQPGRWGLGGGEKSVPAVPDAPPVGESALPVLQPPPVVIATCGSWPRRPMS